MNLEGITAGLKNLFNPQPLVEALDGRNYEVNPGQFGASLGSLIAPPRKPTLQLISLTGFRDVFVAGIDGFDDTAEAKTAIQVVDHNTVALVSLDADDLGRRHEWMRSVNREANPFPFDQYQTPEAFLLALQMGFLPTENIIQLQKFA
ncbi:MAG TPA: hypothetical protein VII58_12610, partial [Acidobacteriaceae bacterium]